MKAKLITLEVRFWNFLDRFNLIIGMLVFAGGCHTFNYLLTLINEVF